MTVISGFAQKSKNSRKSCYTTEHRNAVLQKNPNAQSQVSFEKEMTQLIAKKRQDRTQNAVNDLGTIPVVFHIIHTGQSEGTGYNIAQSRIIAQLNQLNKDYSNNSGSTYSTSSKTGLQFGLATVNPSGATLAQPGINRINVSSASYGRPPYSYDNFEGRVKAATYWDPTKYVNIWVTTFTDDEGILGYATFPSLSTLQGLDEEETNSTAGVVIDYMTVGSLSTPYSACSAGNVYGHGRTLTHEMGHFLGLLHIWGDASCGTDYCDDTPVHETANYGIQTQPKPNTCTNQNEMFENFMDYTDDYLLTTFTVNQAERMQVVMNNSPRRKSVLTSGIPVGAVTNAAKISFLTGCNNSLIVSEKSTVNSDCGAYTDYSLYLGIESEASGTATLNFTSSGTATSGADYQILTPSISVVAGDKIKEFKIRIFDDGIVESSETINLSYTISGTGVVQNTAFTSAYTIQVIDNGAPVIGFGTDTLVNETFGTLSDFPTGWAAYDLETSSTNKFVIGSNGGANTSGSSLYITNNATTKPATYSRTAYSTYLAALPLINKSGYAGYSMKFKYRVGGEWYEGEAYDFGKVGILKPGGAYEFVYGAPILAGNYNTSSGATTAKSGEATINFLENQYIGAGFYPVFYWTNDDQSGVQPGLIIDDVVFTAQKVKVETLKNSVKSHTVKANETVNFISFTNKSIMATISKSATDLTCVKTLITQDGTAKVDFKTGYGNFKRASKVIEISTTAAAANYDVEFYFSKAELAVFDDLSKLKIIKVKSGLDLSTTIAATDAVLYTPVLTNKVSTDEYASFKISANGFSQFILVESTDA